MMHEPGAGQMDAGLTRFARFIDVPARWLLLAIGAAQVWIRPALAHGTVSTYSTVMYACLSLILTLYWLDRRPKSQTSARLMLIVPYLGDLLFAGVLVWQGGGLASQLFILFPLLALKSVGLAPHMAGSVWLPFISGPIYALALRLASGSLAFLADVTFLQRYLLFWIWLLGVVAIAETVSRHAVRSQELESALNQQQLALAQKTEVLQRTATDLGDRVLELRSLQEVSKSLASTLRLDKTLELIVERLRAVSGSSHCAVGLVDQDNRFLAGTLISAASPEQKLFRANLSAEEAAAEALLSDRTLRVPRAAGQAGDLQGLLGGGAFIITPLVSRGRSIGALFLADGAETALNEKTEQLITSFAYFAATAIENARLYQDAWEKRRELEAVLAGIGDGVVVTDPDMRLILMNPVACSILGLEEEPPGGAPLGPYVDVPAFNSLLDETLQGQVDIIRELEFGEPEPEGASRVFGVLASPVLDAEGSVTGAVAVLRDITAQKELERMKSNFLSVVSHELRTPLHSIKGFVEIILMGKTGPVTDLQRDFLQTVKTQTIVLQRMIDDLLEFSRMEAGRIRLHLAETSLTSIANAVVNRLAPLAEESGLQLSVDMPDDLPMVIGDRVRLEQVLTNLVENGIKFTPAGGSVQISGKELADRVQIRIADSGIGVPPEEQERIFDRFYQVDGSERRAYRGAGLGLSICKHIVERHCGRIWVESDGTSGHGSRFCVELPLEMGLSEAPTIDFTTSGR